MFEMQGIRMMHCTIWTEGVREIVSAEDADVKFIISDHPVTIYNHAVPPEAQMCAYPHDPAIALRASQTIFPLNRDFCLILTNLEYARSPLTGPLDKRTFARNYRNSMVRTGGFRARASNSHFWMSSNSRQAGSRSPHVSSFANMDWTRRLHNGRVHRSPLSVSKVGRFLGKGSSEKRSIVDLINVQRGDVVEILVLPNVAA
jgi:hypothetical protein